MISTGEVIEPKIENSLKSEIIIEISEHKINQKYI